MVKRVMSGAAAGIEAVSFVVLMLVLAGSPDVRPAPAARPGGRSAAGPAGIIVLGGGLGPFLQNPKLEPSALSTPNRVAEAVRLARAYPDAQVLYTGREQAPGPLPALIRGGVAGPRIVWEDRSETTAQNATFSAELVHPRPGERWILVTDDWHMDRAARCFARAGFSVEPHPIHGARPDATGLFRPYRETVARAAYAVLGLCGR